MIRILSFFIIMYCRKKRNRILSLKDDTDRLTFDEGEMEVIT